MNWVLVALFVTGAAMMFWGYRVGTRARPEDMHFLLWMLAGSALVAIVALVWVGRFVWGAIVSWL